MVSLEEAEPQREYANTDHVNVLTPYNTASLDVATELNH